MDDTDSIQRCLRITEILEAIVSHVEQTGLARLARTSRFLQDVSLDALYKELNQLGHLLRCMTDDVCTVANGRLTLRRRMERGDLNTLKSYAARVRKLTVREAEPPLPEEVVRALCMIRSNIDPALTPNLRTLHWEVTHPNYVYILPIFISRRLSTFSIPEKLASELWLPNVPPLCPSLSSFSLNGPGKMEVDLGFLDQWSRLEFATCRAITLQAFKRIATCPALQSLAFTIPERSDAWLQAINIDNSSFPKLREAAITCLSLDAASTWLEKLQLQKLGSLRISMPNGVAPPGSVVYLFNILQRHLLSTLSLYSSDPRMQHRHHLSASVLHLLFNCPLLTQLSINVSSFAIDDEDLEALSKAFPKLEILEIVANSGDEPSRITLDGLIPLLKHCPNLCTLNISIDASHVTDHIDRPGDGVCNNRITELSLYNSPIGDVGRVAFFLSHILPNVRTIVEIKTKDSWNMVAKILEAFALAKEQEQRWWATSGSEKLE
ncbi:hypothetical protein BS17DRAFT_776903 [Gyrodon lividus]|nr:hypothetical protein BS17DRAFT_776903 [Gyrodon lividus]